MNTKINFKLSSLTNQPQENIHIKDKEIQVAETKEELISSIRQQIEGKMDSKEINFLLEDLFTENLEQDSWLNSYIKPLQNIKF